LAPLAGPLTHLSDAVVHVIERFANGGAIETGIDDLAKYLNEFTGVIGKPEFLNKVERFASDMGVLGDVVHAAADAVEHPGAAIGKAIMADVTSGQKARWDGIKALVSGIGSGIHSGWDWATKRTALESLANLDKQYGLPANALETLYGKESSYGANVVDQPGANGAQGPFQIKPSMGGGADLHGFDTSSRRAAEIFATELKRYHGDSLKALAAYHLGDPTLDKIIKQYGNDWSKHVPYVNNVKIENNTGGNAIVSASQLTQ
jgi:Transglycosylase SLT domain